MRDYATRLAADPSNHPYCHNWFLEIGHRMGIQKDEDICNDGNGDGKEWKRLQESIFQYSPADLKKSVKSQIFILTR